MSSSSWMSPPTAGAAPPLPARPSPLTKYRPPLPPPLDVISHLTLHLLSVGASVIGLFFDAPNAAQLDKLRAIPDFALFHVALSQHDVLAIGKIYKELLAKSEPLTSFELHAPLIEWQKNRDSGASSSSSSASSSSSSSSSSSDQQLAEILGRLDSAHRMVLHDTLKLFAHLIAQRVITQISLDRIAYAFGHALCRPRVESTDLAVVSSEIKLANELLKALIEKREMLLAAPQQPRSAAVMPLPQEPQRSPMAASNSHPDLASMRPCSPVPPASSSSSSTSSALPSPPSVPIASPKPAVAHISPSLSIPPPPAPMPQPHAPHAPFSSSAASSASSHSHPPPPAPLPPPPHHSHASAPEVTRSPILSSFNVPPPAPPLMQSPAASSSSFSSSAPAAPPLAPGPPPAPSLSAPSPPRVNNFTRASPSSSSSSAAKPPASAGAGRNELLNSIAGFKGGLKKVATVDKSAPAIDATPSSSSSSSSSSSGEQRPSLGGLFANGMPALKKSGTSSAVPPPRPSTSSTSASPSPSFSIPPPPVPNPISSSASVPPPAPVFVTASSSAVPPPPPPGIAGPDMKSFKAPSSSSRPSGGPADRGALLSSISGFKGGLRKTHTVDKSAPLIGDAPAASASSSSSSSSSGANPPRLSMQEEMAARLQRMKH